MCVCVQNHQDQSYSRMPSKRVAMVSRKVFWAPAMRFPGILNQRMVSPHSTPHTTTATPPRTQQQVAERPEDRTGRGREKGLTLSSALHEPRQKWLSIVLHFRANTDPKLPTWMSVMMSTTLMLMSFVIRMMALHTDPRK